MSYNITLDDTAVQLVYSQNGWATQAPVDPNASQFFGGTYHAAQTNGAFVNMTVSGSSAFYIYGSKGPGHVCSFTICLLACLLTFTRVNTVSKSTTLLPISLLKLPKFNTDNFSSLAHSMPAPPIPHISCLLLQYLPLPSHG
jgi:hypothetical protein